MYQMLRSLLADLRRQRWSAREVPPTKERASSSQLPRGFFPFVESSLFPLPCMIQREFLRSETWRPLGHNMVKTAPKESAAEKDLREIVSSNQWARAHLPAPPSLSYAGSRSLEQQICSLKWRSHWKYLLSL